MKRWRWLWGFALLVLLRPSLTLAEEPFPWILETEGRAIPGVEGVVESVWRSARPPGGDFDRIRLHRYTSPKGKEGPRPVLFYLPGTWMNGAVAVAEERYNLWIYLARRGVEVYTLDYRTHALGRGELMDPAALQGWTNTLFLEDARAALAQLRRTSPGGPLFVAGFSRGVAFAYALAAAEGEDIAGIVALDGYLWSCEGPEEDSAAEALQRLEEQGAWAYDVGGSRGWPARQALMLGARDRPGTPLQDEGQPAGELLAGVLHRAWGSTRGTGALANPRSAANPDGVSRPEVLAALMAEYDRYYPAVQDAGALPWAAGIHPAPGGTPVILFASTGMGPEFLGNAVHSAGRAGGRNVEIHLLEGYGHLDILVAEEAAVRIFEPLLAWIRSSRSN